MPLHRCISWVASLLVGMGLAAIVGCGDDLLKTVNGILNPRSLPEPIQFPIPPGQIGAVTGRVVDANGRDIIGARVSNGAVFTFTGDGTARVAKDRGGRFFAPATGDFVLDGIPAGGANLTVTFDEFSTPVSTIVSTNDIPDACLPPPAEGQKIPVCLPADIVGQAAADAATRNKGKNSNYGAKRLQDVKLPMILPVPGAVEALRVVGFLPLELEAKATPASGSVPAKLDFVKSSNVAFILRSGPDGLGAEVVGAEIKYFNENGIEIASGKVTLDSTIIQTGSVAKSGPAASIIVNFANRELASKVGPVDGPSSVAATITFLVKELKPNSPVKPAKDASNLELKKTIPIKIAR